MLWRQGDVLIAVVPAIPAGAQPLSHLVLARGEATGHSHHIRNKRDARLYLAPPDEQRGHASGSVFYLEVKAESTEVVHPEHRAITLKRGLYRVWPQREFSDAGARRMAD